MEPFIAHGDHAQIADARVRPTNPRDGRGYVPFATPATPPLTHAAMKRKAPDPQHSVPEQPISDLSRGRQQGGWGGERASNNGLSSLGTRLTR